MKGIMLGLVILAFSACSQPNSLGVTGKSEQTRSLIPGYSWNYNWQSSNYDLLVADLNNATTSLPGSVFNVRFLNSQRGPGLDYYSHLFAKHDADLTKKYSIGIGYKASEAGWVGKILSDLNGTFDSATNRYTYKVPLAFYHSASAGELIFSATSSQSTSSLSCQIDWSGTPGAQSYRVYYGTSVASAVPVQTIVNRITLGNLKNNTRYYFFVKAVDVSGVETLISRTVSIIPLLSAKVNIGVQNGDKVVYISWPVPADGTTYLSAINRTEGGVTTTINPALSDVIVADGIATFVDNTVTNGVEYTYQAIFNNSPAYVSNYAIGTASSGSFSSLISGKQIGSTWTYVTVKDRWKEIESAINLAQPSDLGGIVLLCSQLNPSESYDMHAFIRRDLAGTNYTLDCKYVNVQANWGGEDWTTYFQEHMGTQTQTGDIAPLAFWQSKNAYPSNVMVFYARKN